MGTCQLSQYYKYLICPRCGSQLTVSDSAFLCTGARSCPYAEEPFPVIRGVPALVDFERSVVSADQLKATSGLPQIDRALPRSRLRRGISRLGHPPNRQASRSVTRMLSLLRLRDIGASRPVVLVVGGGSRGEGLDEIYEADDVDVVAFDIYWSPDVQFIADGHSIPLASETVGAVIIQAVLEHVLEPGAVVREIHRVLAPGGLIYADTPFLWPVHEGAYDFTRFTDSGHRYLLRDFERVDSGVVAGAGTQLMLSIDQFVRALVRSRKAGAAVRLAFFWLAYLDHFLAPKYSVDSASSVFFLGRKSAVPMSAKAIITYYQGAQ
jgi:SAM-dependent methyltransferase